MNSIGIVTALNPILGYEGASKVAKEAFETGGSVIDIVRKKGLIDEDMIDEIFSIENLRKPKYYRKEES